MSAMTCGSESGFEPEFDPREDLDDRDPELPEDDHPPLDVEAAREALRLAGEMGILLGPSGMAVAEALSCALDEVEALRRLCRQLAYWRP